MLYTLIQRQIDIRNNWLHIYTRLIIYFKKMININKQ